MRVPVASLSLVGAAVVLTGCGGSGGGGSPAGQPAAPPATPQSAGNTKISVRATPLPEPGDNGGIYSRKIDVQAQDRSTGAPVCGAGVTVYGQMTSPHLMTLIERPLHQKRCGMYTGSYTFIMRGQWTANFVLRTKKGDASTAAFPLKIGP